MTKSGGVARIDVFSVKGGVGKTTISILLAKAQARHTKRPVLIVDADFAGTCLGHLLAPKTDRPESNTGDWSNICNLAHLICGRPETLEESLAPESIPVYGVPESSSANAHDHHISKIGEFSSLPLYSPSHCASTDPFIVDMRVLQALAGHETAGGWIRYAVQRVIEATDDIVKSKMSPGLGGVIVDHAPGMAATQTAILKDIEASEDPWRAAFVTTCDRVDLKMTSATVGYHERELREKSTYIVNKTDESWKDKEHVKEELKGTNWITQAKSLRRDLALQTAYESSLPLVANADEVEALRRAVFGA